MSTIKQNNEKNIIQTVITSLQLLSSFNNNIPHNNEQITSTSFNNTNEKLLLQLLVELLSINNNKFYYQIMNSHSWPYYDVVEKNNIKKLIIKEIKELKENNILSLLSTSSSTTTTSFKSSLLTIAKGFQIWLLLWKITDMVLVKLTSCDCLDEIMKGSSDDDKTTVLDDLCNLEAQKLSYQTRSVITKQNMLSEYSNELNKRMKYATKEIDNMNKKIQLIESMMGELIINDDCFHQECQNVVNRIDLFISLLEYLLSRKRRKNENNIISKRDVEQLLDQFLMCRDKDVDDNNTVLNGNESSLNESVKRINDRIEQNMSEVKTISDNTNKKEDSVAVVVDDDLSMKLQEASQLCVCLRENISRMCDEVSSVVRKKAK